MPQMIEACFNGDFGDIAATEVFIQWKGTSVCLDFHCSCGADGHVDADFTYALRCWSCGKEWAMPHSIELVPVGDGHNGSIVDVPKGYDDWRDNAQCYVCNKPAVFGSTDLVERTLPGSTATTVVHEDCVFVEVKDE